MKAIILERRGEWAAALREDGTVVKTRAAGEVGQQIEVEEKVIAFPTARNSRWRRMAIAAALALVLAGGSATYVTTAVAASYVSVDMEEASVELSINLLGQVISVEPLNQESVQLAQELSHDLRRKPVEAAVEKTMDRLAPGEDQDVIFGVTGDENLTQAVDRGAKKGKRVCTMRGSKDDRAKAKEKGMSPGKFLAEQDRQKPPEKKDPPPAKK